MGKNSPRHDHHGETSFHHLFMQVNDKPLLDTYTEAVGSNDQFRYFDEAMRDSTSRVLRSFFPHHLEPRNGSGSRSIENQSLILSFESLKAFTAFTLQLCHGVTDIILSLREDTWNNDALFLLAKEYVGIISAQLDFYEAAEDSIKRAKDDAQLFLETALKSVPVDREPNAKDMERAGAYLKMFLEAEEPFGKEFRETLGVVREKHELMLKHLIKAKEEELEKKLQRKKVWAQVSSVLVIALLATVVIGFTVAAAAAAPPVAAALGLIAGVVPGAGEPMVKWVQSLWKNGIQEIEEQLELVRTCTRADTVDVSVREIQCIKQFAAIVSNMHGNNYIDTRPALDDIRREKDQFVSTLDDLHKHIQEIKNEIKRESQRIIDMLANCGESQLKIRSHAM